MIGIYLSFHGLIVVHYEWGLVIYERKRSLELVQTPFVEGEMKCVTFRRVYFPLWH